jgi:hypothetical protein
MSLTILLFVCQLSTSFHGGGQELAAMTMQHSTYRYLEAFFLLLAFVFFSTYLAHQCFPSIFARTIQRARRCCATRREQNHTDAVARSAFSSSTSTNGDRSVFSSSTSTNGDRSVFSSGTSTNGDESISTVTAPLLSGDGAHGGTM